MEKHSHSFHGALTFVLCILYIILAFSVFKKDAPVKVTPATAPPIIASQPAPIATPAPPPAPINPVVVTDGAKGVFLVEPSGLLRYAPEYSIKDQKKFFWIACEQILGKKGKSIINCGTYSLNIEVAPKIVKLTPISPNKVTREIVDFWDTISN